MKLSAYQIAQRLWYTAVVLGSLLFFYVLSILWRVSAAEQEYFGRSCIVPMRWPVREYSEKPVDGSYGQGTFSFERRGKTGEPGRILHVHKQLINGFQHAYGSSLVSYELGEGPANLLFRLNEYVEAFDGSPSNTVKYNLDTRKDLANNQIGYRIGRGTRQLGLWGASAENHIIAEVLAAMDRNEVLTHYLDPRVAKLPSVAEYGCPGLPEPVKP